MKIRHSFLRAQGVNSTKYNSNIKHIIDTIKLNINWDFNGYKFFFISNINWSGILKSLFKRGKETDGFKLSK